MEFKRFISAVCDKAKEIGCRHFVTKAVLSVVNKLVLFKMLKKLGVDGYCHDFANNWKKRDRPIIRKDPSSLPDFRKDFLVI